MSNLGKLVLGGVLFGLSAAAAAQSVTVSATSTTVSTANHVATVTMNIGPAANIAGVSFSLQYAAANQTVGSVGVNPNPDIVSSNAAFPCVVTAEGNINCGGFLNSGTLAANTVLTWQIPFDIGTNVVAAGANPLTIVANSPILTDSNAVETTITTITNGSIAITAAPVATGPELVAGSPAFNSSTAVAGGTLGGAAVTQQITFGAAINGVLGGTSALACTDDDANTTLSAGANQTGIVDGATPTAITASFTPGTARTVVVSCTVTRQNAANQNFTYTFNVAAGVVATGPTLTPPGQVAISVNSNTVGAVGTTSIVFTAAGGNAGQSTPLTCSVATGAPAVTIVSGGNQNVATGSQPAPVVVGVTLTGSAQPNVGTVNCNGTIFTISAPAGSTFVPPEVIPASSLWSQLSLIALFAALGGLMLALRRNA